MQAGCEAMAELLGEKSLVLDLELCAGRFPGLSWAVGMLLNTWCGPAR